MTQTPQHLLLPIKLGSLTLPNRVVMAPMTRSRAGEGDAPLPMNAEYYRQRAGAGLIISEASQISAQGKGYPRTPGIFTEAQIEGWKSVTRAVHAEGGRIFLQLWHVGRISHRDMQPGGVLPVAPSAVKAEGELFTASGRKPYETPRALELNEIPWIVADYRRAAENAKAAEFDGVEIHAGFGYLIDQFLRDGANKRTDSYGGSVENRARFLKEVVEAVIPVFGADRVGVRISPVFAVPPLADTEPAKTFGYVAELLGRYGLAYLHVIQLGGEQFDFLELKRRFRGTYIANGGFDAARADASIGSGAAELVSFASLYLANPDLVERFRAGAELNRPDPTTFYQGEERGYLDYPTLKTSASEPVDAAQGGSVARMFAWLFGRRPTSRSKRIEPA